MKKKLHILTIALIGFVGVFKLQAQDCATNLSIYSEFVKVKNYDSAYEPWKIVYEACPELNPANFVYGERILKYKIQNSAGDEKKAFVDQLLALYPKYREIFPEREEIGRAHV